MTEFLHQPQSEFALTFDLLGRTVLDPNKEYVVLEQSQYPPESQQTEDPAVPRTESLNYLVIERDIHMVIPGSSRRQTEDWQWETGRGPAATIPHPLNESTLARWRRSALPMERGGEGAHKWLLTTFFEKARTPEELAYVLRFGFEQTARLAQCHRQTLGRALHAGVIKSLRFAGEPDAYVLPEAIGRAMNTLGPDDTKWARATLQRHLVNALTAARLKSSQVQQEVQADGSALMVQGIKLYESAGMLDDTFWVEAGIKKVGDVADLPEFMAMVHAKLTGPDGEQIVSRIKDARSAGRLYITAILEHYAQDPRRHQVNAQLVLERTRSAISAEDGLKVDLFSLVQEANRLAAGHNRRVDALRGGQDERYPVLSNGAFNYAEAFWRVLSIMRHPGTDPHVRTEQLEQDGMHADIVAMLFTKQNRREQPPHADLLLRFPDVSPGRLRVARALAARGMDLRKAVERAIKDEQPREGDSTGSTH
jgi:hypothetical protein